MRTTVDTREAAPIPLSARVCPTGLRWCLPHARTAVPDEILGREFKVACRDDERRRSWRTARALD